MVLNKWSKGFRINLKIISLCLVVGVTLATTLPVSAIAPGLQEYYILGYEEHIYRMYVAAEGLTAGDPDQRYMASIVDVTVTADGQVVYYDQWEDGYEADILTPQQTGFVTGTLVMGDGNPANGNAGDYTGRTTDTLLAGDSLSFSSRNLITATTAITGYVPIDPRTAAVVRFDGGDRIVSTGGPIGLVHNMWPADIGAAAPNLTIMGDAWEIYSTQALENGYSYRSPIGEDLAGSQFANVDLQVQALEDNTTVSVGNGVITAAFVLDQGQTYFSMGYIDTAAFTETLAVNVTVGTAIHSDKPVQAGVIAYNSGFQDRYYNMIPDIIWGREYVMPAPENTGSSAEVYIYNPNPYPITVASADRSQSDTFTVPAGSTVNYTAAAGAGVPTLSSIRLSSDAPFWAIAAADVNNTAFDWGASFIPQVFLTDDYYASWAPGNVLQPPLQSVCDSSGNSSTTGTSLCRNASPLWVAAVEDGTIVNVDYNNDDVVDSTFTLDMFDIHLVRDDSDFDQSGTHLWTEGGQKIAVIWGEDSAVAGTGAPNLDVGHLVLPLYQGWLTPPIFLEKTASPEILPANGGTVAFKLTTTAAYFADLDNIVITDTLPYSWTYVTGSTVITYPDGSNSTLEPTITASAGKQTLYWNLASDVGPEQPLELQFRATLTATGGIEELVFDGFETNSYNYYSSDRWLSDWTEENDANNLIYIVGVESGVVPHDGNWQLRLSGRNNSTNDPRIYRNVDLSTFMHPTLSVDRYLYGLELNDILGIDISTNSGVSYTRVLTWTYASQRGDWVREELDLSAYRTSNVRIRIRSISNTDNDDRVYLDNVEIYDRLAVNTNLAMAQAVYRDHTYTVIDRKTVYLSPFELTQTGSASQAALGDTLVFTLTYVNASSAVTGTSVSLNNTLPPGLNFVSASHGGQYLAATNTISWYVGTLAPLTQGQVVFTATLNTTAPPNNGDVVENVAQFFSPQSNVRSNTVAVTVLAPHIVNLTKSAPGNAAPGDVITYTLSYANTGALTATHMIVTDTLPSYVTYVPGSCSHGCTSLPGGILQWDLGEVAPDAVGLLSFAVQITDTTPAGTLLQNAASYTHDAMSDPRTSNTAATLISLVTLNKSADAALVGPDQVVAFTLAYANTGGVTQTHVLIADAIPEFTAYVAGSAARVAGVLTPTYSTDGGVTYQTAEPSDPAAVTHLRWELADLIPGINGSAGFQVRVATADELPNATDIRNQASLTSDQITRLFSNQLVLPTVKLTLDKLGPGIVAPGATFTYTLRFGNPGSGAATVLLSDTLPVSVTFLSANPAPAATVPLTWAVTIPANTNNLDYTVVVSVPADIPVGTELRNAATLSAPQHTVADTLFTYIASPDVTLIPNNTGAAAQLDTRCYPHTLFNNSALTDTVTLTATHSLWVNPALTLYRDVNSNGKYEAATDVTLTETTQIPAGSLIRLLACIVVPADVADGSVNVTTLRAASTAIPGRYSEATDTTTVPMGAGLTLAKSQTDANDAPLYPGDSLTYTLVLANADSITHTGVVLTDAAPAGISFTGGDIQPGGDLTVTAAAMTATLNTFAPGTRVTVTLAAALSVTADTGVLTNTAYADSVQQAAPVSAASSGTVEGLTLAKTAADENGAPLFIGDVIQYVITVTNASTQTAQTSIVVTDSLPAGVAFLSANPTPASQNPLVWNVGTLAPGASWTVTVRVTVDGSADPIGANVAQVSSDQQGEQASDPVLPPGGGGGGGSGDIDPGLSLAKTAADENGAPLYVGDVIRYVITVTNASTQTAQTGIVVTDSLPAGVAFLSASPSSASQNPLVWTVGSLAPGANWTATVRVTVDGSADPIGANVAQVSSNQQAAQASDPALPPGSGGGDVTPITGLGLTKTAADENGAPLYVGDVVRYVITVTNASTQTTQTGVVVTDNLPAGVAFVSANPAPASQDPLVWNVGSFAPGASWTATVRVTVDGSADPIGANVAQVSSDQQGEQASDPVLPPGGGGGDVTPITGLGLAKTAADENGAPLYVGDVVRYVITVTNASTQTTQTGVVVTDTLPAGVAFLSANPAPASQNPLVWNVGSLAPGASWTATVRVTVDGSADPIGANVAQVSSDQQGEQASDPVLPPGSGGDGGSGDIDPGLSLAKTAADENGAPLFIGDVIQYVITVTNANTQTAQTGVVVTDSLPAGVTFVSATPAPASQNPLIWNVGTLNPGASWTATVRVTVDGSADPIGPNVAQVSSDQQAAQVSNPALPPGSGGGDVTPITGLGLTKSAADENGAPLFIGDVIQYVITVTNANTQTAQTGVVVTDSLPAGVTFVSATPAPASQNPLIWNVGTLNPGASWTATVRVTVDGSADPIGANVAQVSSNQQAAQASDPALPPGSGGGDVTPITGLGLTKTAADENGAPLYVGDVIRYVITVTNASTQTTQTGVVVTDSLPAGVAFVSANPAPASQNPLVWNVGSLAPGASWTATVRVTVDGSADPIGANVAQVSSDQQAAQASDPILPPGNGGGDVTPITGLGLTKTAADENGAPLYVGDAVQYVITVTNASTQTAQTGVVVTDSLPAGVTFVSANPAPASQNPLVWNVGSLAPGASWTATIRVTVDGSADPIGANVAQVSSDQQGAQSSQPALPPGGGDVEPSTCPYGADAYEEDDTSATARAIVAEIIQTRNFFDDATDGIALTVGMNDTYTITTVVEGTQADTVLALYDRDGQTLLMENDNYSGLSSRIVWTAPRNGVYYLRVTNQGGVTGCETHYTIQMTIHDVTIIHLPLIVRAHR